MVDADRQPGRFVLTGSQQFGLLAGATQSLAGRLGLTRLLPLAAPETPAITSGQLQLDSALLIGGYPALHTQAIQPANWFASYIATYVERDVRQVLNIRIYPPSSASCAFVPAVPANSSISLHSPARPASPPTRQEIGSPFSNPAT